MITYLDSMALTSAKLHRETEFLIPKFLAKRMITMIYADGGNGKTWLNYGAAAYICSRNLAKMVYYFDLDNPIDELAFRNVEGLLINRFDNFRYIHRSDLLDTPLETLEKLASKEYSRNHAYEDMVFIIDSVRNVTSVLNNEKAMYMMNLLMDIREAGATVLFIAHSNKDGKNYEGSNNLKNSADAMFKEYLISKVEGVSITVGLTAEKERSGVKSCDFTICTQTLDMTEADPIYSRMNSYEKEFVSKAKELLKSNPEGVNKTLFLESLGFKKDDTTARDTLDKFTEKFWKAKKDKNRFTYTLIR
ncbi:MAG: AAA family ATPase [Campylobacterales bacterium]|nr:AAA family ATPase [Campylobacterales bacterium]